MWPGGAVVRDSIAFVEEGLVGDSALDWFTGLGVIGEGNFYSAGGEVLEPSPLSTTNHFPT